MLACFVKNVLEAQNCLDFYFGFSFLFFFFCPLTSPQAAAVVVVSGSAHPGPELSFPRLVWRVLFKEMLMVDSQDKAVTEVLRWLHCLNVDTL